MEPEIIFEDQDFLILEKPSGWVVNEAKTTNNTPVIQTWLRKCDFPIANSLEYRSGIVHRLDKETSGILIVAKNVEAFIELQSQFKSRIVKKSYLALVHGNLKSSKGRIEAPVGRLPWNRERFGILPGGREAITDFDLITTYENSYGNYSLVRFLPQTGRTHQIRIHSKYLGCPLVSDNFYAGRKTSRKDRLWCPRLFLHAETISFKHPRTGEVVNFSSDLPDDLQQTINSLEKIEKTA